MKIPMVILQAIEILKKCFGGVEIEILDTEMSRKFPDSFAPQGYLGINISVCVGNITDKGNIIYYDRKHCVFLTYQFAEDIIIYGSMIADGFIATILNEDISEMERKIKLYYRKQKLKRINESF